MKFSVNASKLKLASTCMADNDIRYYLNGVLVAPRAEGGVYLVATDGHRLMAVIDESGSVDKERIIRFPKSFLAKLPKIGSSQETATVTNERIELKHALFLTSEKGEMLHADITADDINVDGQFPDWRRVIKFDPDSVVRPGPINMRYLATALPAFTTLKFGLAVRFYSLSDTDCTCVRFDRHDFAIMVVMPMREDCGDATWRRNWTTGSAKPAAARDAAMDKALSTAFTALDTLAAKGLVTRLP